MRIIAQPLTPNAFAPYGDVLAPPAEFGRVYFEKGLRSGRTTAGPSLSVARRWTGSGRPSRLRVDRKRRREP
jgi:hypothetical protein